MHKQQNQPQPLALPEPEKKYTFEFTENQLIRFITFWFALYKTEKFLQEIQDPLLALGSRYGDEALKLHRRLPTKIRCNETTISSNDGKSRF